MAVKLPWYESLSAGFPSPADDYCERVLSLDEVLVPFPERTICVRVRGRSMEDAMVRDGDIAIIEKSDRAREGDVIVALLDGEFLVKRLRRRGGQLWLYAESAVGPAPILIDGSREFRVWGIVRHSIHRIQ